jgi:hypothetical protein
VVPPLPSSIQSLTLELFSLGYPPGFLTALIGELPELKSLVVYSQLFAGISDESRQDALDFFERATGLRALHLLDVFARPHFIDAVAPVLRARERGLVFLEVSYTARHTDEHFLDRVPGAELPLFVVPSLVTCSFNVSLPDATNDPDDPSNLAPETQEGIVAYDNAMSPTLVEELTAEKSAPRALKALNTTLYTLSASQLRTVLERHKGLIVLNVTVELEPTREYTRELMEAISLCTTLEQVEIVGSPSTTFRSAVKKMDGDALQKVLPSLDDIKVLSEKCKSLNSFTANVLRTSSWGSVEWTKNGETWEGGAKEAVEPTKGSGETKPVSQEQNVNCCGLTKSEGELESVDIVCPKNEVPRLP